jgi:hypothetical protein
MSHSEKGRFSAPVSGKAWRPREVRHRPCLYYSWRRAAWSGGGDGAAIGDGDSMTVTLLLRGCPRTAVEGAQSAVRANAPPKPNAQLDQQLLEGLQEMNSSLQVKQVENLKQLYGRQRKGVEAQKAK